jgi:hypothetical protein
MASKHYLQRNIPSSVQDLFGWPDVYKRDEISYRDVYNTATIGFRVIWACFGAMRSML